MKILAIDPGTRFMGYAIVADTRPVTIVEFSVLKLKQTDTLANRLHAIHTFCSEMIRAHGITHIALETPFLGKNVTSYLKLGYVRGVLYLLSAQHSLTLCEFAPTQIKQAITGTGSSTKDSVASALKRFFPSHNFDVMADATDALAVALTAACSIPSSSSRPS